MDIQRWLTDFRELHEAARANSLGPEGITRYHAARERLAQALCMIQGLGGIPGRTARQTFRVAQAVNVDLRWEELLVRAVTVDIAVGGFAATVARPQGPQVVLEATLHLGQGRPPLVARARVVNVSLRSGASRVSYAFVGLPPEDRDRLEFALFDWALARMSAQGRLAATG